MMRADGIAWSSAASSSRIVGDLPPNSSVTRFMVAAPSRMICSPTPTEPVKEILSTSGLRTSSAPTTSPRPITTLHTPLGSLAALTHSIITCVCSELNSLGLRTTVQPAATADASLRQIKSAFAFHAVNQAGHADRLQGDRRLAPAFGHRQLLESPLSRQKGTHSRLHDGPCELHHASVLLHHRCREITDARGDSLMHAASGAPALVLPRPAEP